MLLPSQVIPTYPPIYKDRNKMKQNGSTLLLFLLLSLTARLVSPNFIREKEDVVEEMEEEVEEAEEKVEKFWGGACLVDQDCLRLKMSDVSLQVSVCQSSRAQCEPIAILWVLTAFLALVIVLITTIAVLYFCNRK